MYKLIVALSEFRLRLSLYLRKYCNLDGVAALLQYCVTLCSITFYCRLGRTGMEISTAKPTHGRITFDKFKSFGCTTFKVAATPLLASLSFSQGKFPTLYKNAQIKPLLKKPIRNPDDAANCQPISNLKSQI